MTLAPGAAASATGAYHLGAYRLHLTFDDGAERVVDFEPFLRKSRNPLIRAYLQQDRFSDFRVQDGDLMWGDYDLCFPVADLYEDRI